jgi:hypothetical protein
MENKHNLTEKQFKAKIEFIENLKNEINQIQNDIEHIDEKNRKIKLLRNLKYSLTFGRLLVPYVAAVGVTFGIFSYCGRTPFFVDDCKKNLEIKKTLDSLGNIQTEEQYQKYEEKIEYLTYYGKWEINNDGIYEREIRIYNIKNINEDLIYEVFNNINNLNLDDLFGGNFFYKIEKRNRLSEDELEQKPFLEATIYDKNENEYIIEKEEIMDNIAFTFLWFVLSFAGIKGIDYIIKKHTTFNYLEAISKIKEKYPLISEEWLKQLLEIKEDNYKRLMR